MRNFSIRCLTIAIVGYVAFRACGEIAVVRAEDLATLKGRFHYGGDTSAVENDLAVDPDTKGLANVLVYRRSKKSEARPSSKPPGSATLTLSESGFDKQLVAVERGGTLEVKYAGNSPHNVVLLRPGLAESPVLSSSPGRTFELDQSYALPIQLACNLHRDEKAFVFVHANAQFDISNERGEFAIEGIPPGEQGFQVWHAVFGPLAARPEWKRGRLRLMLRPGEVVDFGKIEVDVGELTRDE